MSLEKELVIVNELGLHARPAAIIVREASNYENDINIIYNGKTYTLKSIMMVMSLGIKYDETFSIDVEGDNAEIILDNIEKILVSSGIV